MERQIDRLLPSLEFTYDWYRALLDRLQHEGYAFRTFSEAVESNTVLLRHDVDLSIEKALTTARIEAERGIEATYCVLLTSPLYNPLEGAVRDKLQAIESLGHEVALHFSTHEYWDDRPADGAIESKVEAEREILGTVLEQTPRTVSFHIPPKWVLDRSFDGFTNTYDPAYFSDIEYVADSGQRWRDSTPSVTDLSSTVQILTHPGLWGETDRQFEECVDRNVTEACLRVDRKAQREFCEGAYSQ